ncbi:MAG: ABC transporter ATP-binding protein/permease [Lachnospiraceae bacterium]|nr:ABC transporter ATP-binding protein/permease [Lachnospiraceae bacterium]
MYKITNYLKEYKKESIIAPLFKMLEASFELFVPLVMAAIVDIGIKEQNNAYIIRMGAVLILLGIVGLVCSITAQYFAAKASVGFGKSVRRDLFAHINSLSYTEIDQAGTSTLITRMTNDINQLQSGVNMFLRLFLRSPFIVAGAMVMAFTVDIKAALVFVLAIPLLSVVVFGIMLYSIPLYQKVQKALDHVLLMTRENLVGARVIRAFCRQEDEKQDYREGSDVLMQMQTFVGKISAMMNPVTYIIVNAAIIAIIWIGGVQVSIGNLTQGEVIALVNYMSQILVELVKLANLIILLTKAAACSKRVGEVFAMSASVVEHPTGVDLKPTENKVEFRNVTFTYQGAKEPALKDVSFTAKKGQTIGIIGGTGCGKSTLVNLIPRFYDVTAGDVFVDQVNVKNYSFHQLRDRIGVVPQKAVLFNGTIADNLRWGKEDATEQEMENAIQIAQGKDVIASKKNGLEEIILQGGKNLSGGQRQRLTIARALIREPEILILDDSASALDFATDAKLRKAIKEQTKGMTVFIVSQRAATIKQADQIIVLEDGAVAGIGTHEELMKKCDVYQEIVKSQDDTAKEKKEEKKDGR